MLPEVLSFMSGNGAIQNLSPEIVLCPNQSHFPFDNVSRYQTPGWNCLVLEFLST